MAKVKTWSITVGEDKIEASDEGLYVNGKLQDKAYGITTCTRYTGKLTNGKEIKVVIGAEGIGFKMHCSIFVDCELVFEG